MFGDFDEEKKEAASGGRRMASLGVAALIFVLVGSGIAAALASVRVVIRERDQDVTFEDLPLPPPPEPEVIEEAPPPPPPPPPRRVRRDRPRGQRPVLDGPPTQIPDEIPEEAEGDLAEATNTGPIENGAEMGDPEGTDAPAPEVVAPAAQEGPVAPRPVAPPPEQVRETITRARYNAERSQCRSLVIPDDIAEALGARTVRVRVRALVDPEGNVVQATILEGDEAIPEALILDCANRWAFTPARLPDGTAVPYPAIRTFVIRPRL